MPKIRTTVIAAAIALTLGACVTTRTASLTTSTARLEHNADALARDSGPAPVVAADAPNAPVEDSASQTYPNYPSTYSRDAHALAVDARNLRHVVEDGYGPADVQSAFDRVSRSYHAVRDEVDHSDNRAAHDDLQAVTDAYVDVEHALNVRPAT